MFTAKVLLPHPVPVVFAYVTEPAHRAEWQRSLKRVELISAGPTRVGTRWRDITWAGMRPVMEITALEPDRMFAERGEWGRFTSSISLRFEPVGHASTRVHVEAELVGRTRSLRALEGAARRTVVRDLERAGRVLGTR